MQKVNICRANNQRQQQRQHCLHTDDSKVIATPRLSVPKQPSYSEFYLIIVSVVKKGRVHINGATGSFIVCNWKAHQTPPTMVGLTFSSMYTHFNTLKKKAARKL